jgi:hypothetical protein
MLVRINVPNHNVAKVYALVQCSMCNKINRLDVPLPTLADTDVDSKLIRQYCEGCGKLISSEVDFYAH